MSNVLTEILAAKADHVAACKRRVPPDKIEHLAAEASPPRFGRRIRSVAPVTVAPDRDRGLLP